MKAKAKAAAAPGFEERLSSHQTRVLAWRSVASRDSANSGGHPSTAPLGHELAVDIGGVAEAVFDGIEMALGNRPHPVYTGNVHGTCPQCGFAVAGRFGAFGDGFGPRQIAVRVVA